MQKREDSDIKIFKPTKQAENDSGIIASVEGMNHHRQNGNVDKAKALGLSLADVAFSADHKAALSSDMFFEEPIFQQVCALVLFSTEAALNYYLPSQQLSTIAINSLHEALSKKNSPVYSNVMNSPAFSFYYLSVRKGGTEIPEDIGEAFAMLCRHEEDELFINEGKKLYNMILDLVEKEICKAEFAN